MKLRLTKHKYKKYILIIVSTMVLIGASLLGYNYLSSINSKSSNDSVPLSAAEQELTEKTTEDVAPDTTVHFVAMGDMLAHDTIIANAKTDSSYDFGKFFSNVKSDYANADVVFCNQEGLSAGESYGISGYPSFNAPKEFSSGLQTGAGCNVINLANNHMGDKGVSAINETLDVWRKLDPYAYAGANASHEEQQTVRYFEVKGIKFAFMAFADFNNNKSTPSYAVNLYHDTALVESLVNEARSHADVVVVSMHWGVEDSSIVSQSQSTTASWLNQLGVDVIIGTGPHVLQKYETITNGEGKTTYAWYSLGNMLSSQLQTAELIGGIAKFDIDLNDQRVPVFSNISFSPTYMHYEWSASDAANGNLLARKNAMIYMLKNSEEPLSRSLLNTTVDEQMKYVVDTIGPDVNINL